MKIKNMTPEELKEQAHREFDEKYGKLLFKLDSIYGTPEKRLEVSLKSFINSLMDRTVQATENRIVGEIEDKKIKNKGLISLSYANGKSYDVEAESDRMIFYNQALDDIIYLITNKSNTNK